MQREKVIMLKENSGPRLLSAVVAAVISLLLCTGFTYMVGTAFTLEFDFWPVVLWALFTSFVFAFLNYLNKRSVSVALIVISAILMIILVTGDYMHLKSALSSFMNNIQQYSFYLLPGEYINTYVGSHAIDTLLILYNLIAAGVITFAVTRRRFIPLSLLVFLPHFLLSVSNTSMRPEQTPCIVTAAGIFLALLTHAYRYKKRETADKTMLILAVPVLLFAVMWGAIFPVKEYEKYEVAKKFLLMIRDAAEESSSFDNTELVRIIDRIYHGTINPNSLVMTDGSYESTYTAVCPSSTDLTTVGPFNPPHTRILTVYKSLNSNYKGTFKPYEGGFLYLKVESMDTYKDNVLSASDIYMHVFKEDFKPEENNAQFAITITPDVGSSVDILPYYCDYCRARTDIYTVSNPYNTTENGTFYYLASPVPVKTGNIYSDIYLNDYVYNTSLKVPKETEKAIIDSGVLPDWYLDVYYGESDMSDADKVRKVTEFVSNLHPYDKDTELPPEGADFVPWFISEAQSGICVHYATTSMVLLRMIGIPARYVRGYIDAGSYPQKESTVYASESHAWFEFFIPEFGWIMGDPTPGASFGASYSDINAVASAYPEIETEVFSRHDAPERPLTTETSETSETSSGTSDNSTETSADDDQTPASHETDAPSETAETSSDQSSDQSASNTSPSGSTAPSASGSGSDAAAVVTDENGETVETDENGEVAQSGKPFDLTPLYPVFLGILGVIRFILILIIVLLVLAVAARIVFYTYWMIHFSVEDTNEKAITYYHYFRLLSRFARRRLPKNATAIAEKAAFGSDPVTKEEVIVLLKSCKKNSVLISQKLPWYMEIVYRFMEINIKY